MSAKRSKADIDQVAVTNRDFMSESERDDSARDREQSLLGRRQLGTVIAAREQAAVGVASSHAVTPLCCACTVCTIPTRHVGRRCQRH